MDKANDIEDLVRQIAESLSIGERVRYDLKTLSYGNFNELNIEEYGEYLDMEELPDDIEDELHDWQLDYVRYLRDVMDLPDFIDPPRTGVQLEWMADFANEQSSDSRYIRNVQRALDSRHPFGAFKDVMADHGLLENWYRYREECYKDYVRRELGVS